MDWVDQILGHPDFLKYLRQNAKAEKERTFCCHDLQHALDVARVAYIHSLENGYPLKKELIYVTALLHDIAKWKQYRDQTDHAAEGAVLAERILREIGTEEPEIKLIVEAIAEHRTAGKKSSMLSEVLYAGDKMCRPCIACEKVKECKRFADGKKPELKY